MRTLRSARSSHVSTMTSSPTWRPSRASSTSGSKKSDASGAPSSPCFGAAAGSVSGDSTLPIGDSSIRESVIRANGSGLPSDPMGLLGRIFGSDETKVEAPGVSGQATIVSLSEGGPYVNQRPTITMELDVVLPGRESYRAQARQPVGRLVIGRLEPGATIPVRVNPRTPRTSPSTSRRCLGSPTPRRPERVAAAHRQAHAHLWQVRHPREAIAQVPEVRSAQPGGAVGDARRKALATDQVSLPRLGVGVMPLGYSDRPAASRASAFDENE